MRQLVPALLATLLVGPLLLPAWDGDDAVAALRGRLRTRGYTLEVTAGPMVAVWSDDAPAAPVPSSPALPQSVRAIDPGAYLVMTDGGDWWVWSNGLDAGPLATEPPLPPN